MRRFFITCAAILVLSPDSGAGWVTVKNDTQKTVYLQEPPEGFLPGVFARRRRPVRLTPGESFREFQAEPGEKSLDVYDADSASKPVHKAIIKWGPTDVTFTLSTQPADAAGAVRWAFVVPKPAGPVVAAKAEEKTVRP